MSSSVSRLLLLGVLSLGGCSGANENPDDALSSTGTGQQPEAGSGGRWTPPNPAGTAGKAASAGTGSQAAQAGRTSMTVTTVAGMGAAQAGRASAAGGAGSPAAVSGGTGGTAGTAQAAAGAPAAGSSGPVATEKFSFFVTSLEAMRRLSKSENGFGGDLRYGEATGLAGADKICTEIAESSMPGAGGKVWHAFLSAKSSPSGGAVNAKDRIGKGPWYDRNGRIVAMDLEALLQTRPEGADPAIADNLPNEKGEPNRASEDVDNHDTVTGSNELGEYSGGATCEDWTTTMTPPAAGSGGGSMRGGGSRGPMCGHSWPANSGMSWIKAHNAPGCAPSVSLVQMGGGSGDGIGNGGGYGGFYCFALTP